MNLKLSIILTILIFQCFSIIGCFCFVNEGLAFTPPQTLTRRGSALKPRKMVDISSTVEALTTLPTAIDSTTLTTAASEFADELVAGTLNGLAGGAVGVMGTLFALELKKQKVQKRAECPYCNGEGHLQCTACLASGTVMVVTNEGIEKTCTCGYCEGTSYVTCVNCKGDGRAVPLMLNRQKVLFHHSTGESNDDDQ